MMKMRLSITSREGCGSRRVVSAWLLLACAVVAAGAIGLASSGIHAQGAAGAAPGHVQPGGPDWIPDYIMVRVVPGVKPVVNANGRWSFAMTNEGLAGLNPQAKKAAQRAATEAKANIRALLRQANTVDVKAMSNAAPHHAARAKQHRLDRYFKVDLPAGTSVAEAQALAAALEAEHALIERAELDAWGTTASVTPNDPNFNLLWGLNNTANPNADIDAPNAWMITKGAPQMVLAILDSGVSAHAELSGRLVPGFNTVDNSNNTVDGCNHGTHVTGTAAATTNNGVGIAGVNWNVRIMPVRVLTGCNGTEMDLGEGLIWAADNGAHVINMSLQFTSGSSFLHDAVNYARAAGVALYAAAGNFGTSGGVAFPGRWPETTTVAATNSADQHWQFSNTGPEVTIAGPGVDVYSLSNAGGYFYNTGTSMATPHVAGLACLMLTVDPTLTHDEIQQILIDTADDLGAAGFDIQTGWGRINAAAALQATLARLGIPGDVNGDESLNEADRAALQALIGVQWGEPAFNARADLNHDGTIDAADEAILDGLLPCVGDLVNSQTFQPPGDGEVGGADLAFLLGAWGINPDSPADMVSSATFQPPPDGLVDGADLGTLLGAWGACAGE